MRNSHRCPRGAVLLRNPECELRQRNSVYQEPVIVASPYLIADDGKKLAILVIRLRSHGECSERR